MKMKRPIRKLGIRQAATQDAAIDRLIRTGSALRRRLAMIVATVTIKSPRGDR